MYRDPIALTGRYLAMRIETDPEYAGKLKKDPANTLREAGLPDNLERYPS